MLSEHKIIDLCLNSVEAVFQIGNDIVNMLGTDGQADGILIDAYVS